MKAQIVIVAQHTSGQVDPVTYEVIACAQELGRKQNFASIVVVLGKKTRGLAQEIADTCGLEIIGIENEALEMYNAEAYRAALGEALMQLHPAYIVLPHTSMGYDLAAPLSIDLKAACITSVEAILTTDHAVSFQRSLFSGKIIAQIVPCKTPAVLTIQPGAWRAEKEKVTHTVEICITQMHLKPTSTKTICMKPSEHEGLDLNQADVIIAAGKGIGNEENLSLIFELAKIFPNSAVGSSRTVCDQGWLGYQHQIGSTGKTVAPKLYVAVGISGAIQHITGMKDSQVIVAINKDPNASIFSVAEYCIVEDLEAFIPALLDEYRQLKSGQK
ncbi:MAG: electron transfer flavoprotein subunit alpha/FixB family protein [Deltaproteobacteria bacterium]|nr:electron transfer flavoprotein subunit alpha/FixB family protein [Deltaproteobacteria bacterium]